MIKQFIFVMSFFLIVPGFCQAVANKDLNPKTEIGSIKGTGKIVNMSLRQSVIKYLSYVAKYDFANEYEYLSSRWLKQNYPAIKTAKEFDQYMKENTEEYIKIRFEEISECKKVNENRYEIDIISRSQESPEKPDFSKNKVKERMVFVKENKIWKFEGYDKNIYEVINP